MTRVVRVFSRLNIGGPSLHVIHLTAGLVPRGFETTLVIGQSDPSEGDFLDLARSKGVAPVILPEMGRAIRPLDDLRALVRVFRLIRQRAPEIVHTHTAKAGAIGRAAALLARVPVIVHTYHGHVLSGYFSPLTSAIFRRIEWALAPGSDALLTVSESVRDDLARLGVASRERIRILPLGLDLEPLSHDLPRGTLRREAGWPEDAFVVGIVGRLVPIKDLDTFIDAAALMLSQAPSARFAIVGDGEERSRLEPIARARLGDAVRFFGWRKDTGAVLGDLDLSVNTSLNEGTPVSLIEALAAGRPVVATSVGGTPDLLDGGQYGALASPHNAASVAEAMLDALRARQRAQEKARAGQAMVLEKYSVNRLIDDMDRLYLELLATLKPS